MTRLIRGSLLMSVLMACFALSVSAQSIPAEDAAKHIGEKATVCGKIASERTAENSRGTPTFINLDKPYPNQIFTVLVWGDERSSVGTLPTDGRLCAIGTISDYRGVPEIVLHKHEDWFVPKE